jgi:hypothetical protein
MHECGFYWDYLSNIVSHMLELLALLVATRARTQKAPTALQAGLGIPPCRLGSDGRWRVLALAQVVRVVLFFAARLHRGPVLREGAQVREAAVADLAAVHGERRWHERCRVHGGCDRRPERGRRRGCQ